MQRFPDAEIRSLLIFPSFSAMLDMWMPCPKVIQLSLNFVKLRHDVS